jgi:cytochrome c biogenesis protein CcmG/thiol:disulfide interchange protein DsbE
MPSTKSLADYKGQVVLLNIWGTFCLPCRDEMPAIEKLHQAMAPQGLKVVAVSMDDPGFEKQIRSFVKEFGLTFQILYDPSGKITNDYQTTGVPETFIIARDGVIRKKVIGASDWNSEGNRALISQLLAEPGK